MRRPPVPSVPPEPVAPPPEPVLPHAARIEVKAQTRRDRVKSFIMGLALPRARGSPLAYPTHPAKIRRPGEVELAATCRDDGESQANYEEDCVQLEVSTLTVSADVGIARSVAPVQLADRRMAPGLAAEQSRPAN